jgi:hypothetical protein
MTKNSKLHTRKKQETNMKESKKKTRNMNQCKKQIMKGDKNKAKKKEFKNLPPSSLMFACLLPPQSK